MFPAGYTDFDGKKGSCLQADGARQGAGPPFRLVKENAECMSSDMSLGEKATRDECAEACINTADCKFFIYGKGSKSRRCWFEYTQSEDCPEGWEPDEYDFYEIISPSSTSPLAEGRGKHYPCAMNEDPKAHQR